MPSDLAMLARRPFTWAPRAVSLMCAAVLLVAVALKGLQLATDPLSADLLFGRRWVGIVLVNSEFALALLLVGGAYPHWARWASISCFLAFAVVSLLQAVAGKSSCGCFGQIVITPWLAFSIDILAVVACWVFAPDHRVSCHSSDVNRRGAAVATLMALGLLGDAVIIGAGGQPPVLISPPTLDLGVVGRGQVTQGTLQLRNQTQTRVEIDSVRTSCPCLVVHLPSKALEPTEAVDGIARLDMGTEPEFRGDLRIEIRGRTRDGRVLFVAIVDASVR